MCNANKVPSEFYYYPIHFYKNDTKHNLQSRAIIYIIFRMRDMACSVEGS